ncbi:hypothetical protein D0T53_13400 [Dysgonomonas sp. 216]|uniref:hypothetical protein n=1 Tax=Dysgonomonas sp. 216 TaxID=2302934 RepID=UPI0013D4168E|nr:hypothetical protein [Dysgonomonas sp. 216]NDW19889.1 hypothetical protein [Dysgonomonas sp. 216]
MHENYIPKTEQELENWMKRNCFNFNNYSINGNLINEGFGIDKVKGLFIWFYTERGQKSELKSFHTEQEVIKYAYEQIKTDKWAKTHCIGFTSNKSKAEKLCSILNNMKIQYIEDIIPYYGIQYPVYRIFVLGCDIKKTQFLRKEYWTEK